MNPMKLIILNLVSVLALSHIAFAEPLAILNLPGSGTDPDAIDFENLPRLKGRHAVINQVAYSPDYKPGEKLEMNRMRLNLHNYLIHHDDKFWCLSTKHHAQRATHSIQCLVCSALL